MPPYPHLLGEDLDFKSISYKVRAMKWLGVPYTDEDIANAEASARAQAAAEAKKIVDQKGPGGLEEKKVVALIAYLQRMGTDLFKPATPVQAPAPTTAPTTAPVTASAHALSNVAGGK